MKQSKFEKTISVSLGLSAAGLMLMGLILMFTVNSEIWCVPAVLGFACTAGMLHWDNRAVRAATREVEERIRKNAR